MKLILVLASLCLVASANMGGPHNNTQGRPRRHLDSSSSSSSSSDSDDGRRRAQKIDVINPVVVVEQSPAAASSQYRPKRAAPANATQIRNTRQVLVPVPVDTSSDSDSDELDNVAVVNPVVVVEQDPVLVPRQKRAAPANSTQPRLRRHLSSSSDSSSDSDEFRPTEIDVINPVVAVEQTPSANPPMIGQGACPNQIRSRRQVVVPAPLPAVVPIDDSSDSDSDEFDNVAVVNPVVVVEQDPALGLRQKRAAPANATQPRPRRHLDSSSSSSSDSDEFRRPEIDVINPVVVVGQTPAPVIVGQGVWPAPNAAQNRPRRQVLVPAPVSPVVALDDSSDSDSDDDDDVTVVNPVVVVEQDPVFVPRQKRAAPANATQIRNTRQVIMPVPVDSSSDSDSDELDNVAVVNPPVVVVEHDTGCGVIQKRSVPVNATQQH